MDRIERSLSLLEEKEKETTREPRFCVPGVKRRPPLSKRAVQLMENWYHSNLHHPYPSATVCEALALSGSISVDQVKKWFGNKRSRQCNTRPRSEIAKRKFRSRHGLQDSALYRVVDLNTFLWFWLVLVAKDVLLAFMKCFCLYLVVCYLLLIEIKVWNDKTFCVFHWLFLNKTVFYEHLKKVMRSSEVCACVWTHILRNLWQITLNVYFKWNIEDWHQPLPVDNR